MSDKFDKPDHTQQHLANERTFLAWIRTCIALVGLGFIVSKFTFFLSQFRIIIDREAENDSISHSQYLQDYFSSILGISIIVLSIGLVIVSLMNFFITKNSIDKGLYKSNNRIIYASSVIIIILSIIIIVYLILL